MATVVVDKTIILQAGIVTDLHEVATGKRDIVTVNVANRSGSTATYSLYKATNGAAHNDDQAWVPNEQLASPGSDESFPKVLGAGTILRAESSVGDFAVWINGISQDVE